MSRASAVAVPCIGLLAWSILLAPPSLAQNSPTVVATIGDSFADAIYLAMKARPDLLKKHDIKLVRWSRPIIGLARTDYFDYPSWLSESVKVADVCVIQIGSNDMQALHDHDGKYLTFGTEAWKDVYRNRVKGLAGILAERRCKQILWLLQPGFERQRRMAEKHLVINAVQSEALQPSGSMVFELITSKLDYGSDNTHFNRNFILKLGDAIFELSAASKGLLENRCFACHKGFRAENVSSPLNRRQGGFVRLKATNSAILTAEQIVTDFKERSSAPPRRSQSKRSPIRQAKLASHPAG